MMWKGSVADERLTDAQRLDSYPMPGEA